MPQGFLDVAASIRRRRQHAFARRRGFALALSLVTLGISARLRSALKRCGSVTHHSRTCSAEAPADRRNCTSVGSPLHITQSILHDMQKASPPLLLPLL